MLAPIMSSIFEPHLSVLMSLSNVELLQHCILAAVLLLLML
jgi:hypothetical protein